MKYLYTPNDLALFFYISDLSMLAEKSIIDDLWENQKSSIPFKYRSTKKNFRKHIYHEICKFDFRPEEFDEVNQILQDMGTAYNLDGTINEQGVIESYFKRVKLQLTYNGSQYKKMKLRNLLGAFGYRRRTGELVTYIERTLNALGLVAYLRGYIECNIADIKLNDTVIIRLKTE